MSQSSAPVLLATSLVAGTADLLRGAHAVARALGAPLDCVYAVSAGRTAMADDSILRRVEHAATERLSRQRKRLGIPAGHLGETTVRRGQPGEVVLEEAARRGARLIVIRGSDRGRRIGSTTDRILRGAQVPVLVVRGKGFGPVRRALFAVQLDRLAEDILRRGLDLARALAAGKTLRCEALYALPHLYLDFAFGSQTVHITNELEQARQDLAHLITRVAGRDAKFRRTVVNGYPWLEILRRIRSSKPDLVVLGTHGEHGVKRLLLGSVAADVVRSAPCSALVIPPAAARA